ncbi:hypothetical protein [Streptomyces sp. NPDC042319]|uniref:hypothetical protein n=1 Tax=Streptomyces sp. NPDC042319 TaxID=3154332 RepID=UPI0034035B7E
MKLLFVCTALPVLCAAFQDLGSEYGGLEWLTLEYAVWPLMIAPVAMLAVFITHRELIRNPGKGARFSQTIKVVACLFLFLNVIAAIGYTWPAALSALVALSIPVADRRLKKQAAP